jgi:periplasmic divalent cation tolerance protein
MKTEALIVLCTCPGPEVAERLAAGLVVGGRAACVNILPQIRSIYRWEGAVNNDPEALMIIKTSVSAYADLESWLAAHHPYEVPEIIALTPVQGSAAYLDWVTSETTGSRSE